MRVDLFDGKWHQLTWHFHDLSTNRQSIVVDGQRIPNLGIGRSDAPTNFTKWDQWAGIGVGIAASEPVYEYDSQFTGSIMDVKLWDGSRSLIAHWPMNEGSDEEVRDATGLKHGTLTNVQWVPTELAEGTLYFNGMDSYVNVGSLGDFGKHVGSCSIELWFKPSIVTDTMSLLHITDNLRKHACLAIELNTDSQWNYEKGTALFYVRDARGDVLSATVKHDLVNDEWHELIWTINNASLNQMSITIDGLRMEHVLDQQNSPITFRPWGQWLCLGAANKMGQKVSNHYKGYMKELQLLVGHSPIAHWPMREGIGAKILFDDTGNGNNGVCRMGQSWTATWHLVALPFSLERQDLDMEEVKLAEEETRWENNVIKVSYLQVYGGPGESGLYQEQLFDCLNQVPLMGLAGREFKEQRASGEPTVFMTVPEYCWMVSSSNKVHKHFESGQSFARTSHTGKGHQIFTLQVGDARLTIFDLCGHQRHRQSTFDPVLIPIPAPQHFQL